MTPASAGQVNRLAEQSGIDIVQLHGEEDSAYIAAMKKPVVKVVHVTPDATTEQVGLHFTILYLLV